MELDELRKKLIFQMTGEEFISLQKLAQRENQEQVYEKHSVPKRYVYGIRGIAQLLKCSKSKANRIKKSGVIDEAIIQNGRKIIVDVELALQLIKNSN